MTSRFRMPAAAAAFLILVNAASAFTPVSRPPDAGSSATQARGGFHGGGAHVRPGGGYHGGYHGGYRGGYHGGHNVYVGGWRRPTYGWGPGGAIAAGAAIGFMSAAAAAAYATSAAPAAGLCWYYTDASGQAGFWDTCP
jgi:hypothetical protein